MVQEIELKEVFDYADNINVYSNGNTYTVNSDDKLFGDILTQWKSTICGARIMPAFGVSLNELTLAEMKKGLWIEFNFNKRYESDGLPYEKLLIAVHGMDSGFNLIRYTREYGYDGRCFYYDLVNKNMADLFNLLNDTQF